jgi:hypothetical protein
LRARLARVDLYLVSALILALIFSVYGITWGRVESWNPDNMVYRLDFVEQGSLHPGAFQKPPFHTYLSYFLVRYPVLKLAAAVHLPRYRYLSLELISSRLLTVLFLLGILVLIFVITRRAWGAFAARGITLVLATSAGFITYAHFLTVDIPVAFWMLLAFYFAQRILYGGGRLDYALAGFLTGIATATKYNGLAVGVAMPVAHLLASRRSSWRQALLDGRLLGGLLMVPIGFIFGNPYAALDYPAFVADFMYNLSVTPVYEGTTSGHGYLLFFSRMVDLVGLPAFVLSCVLVVVSAYCVVSRRVDPCHRISYALPFSVFALYFLYLGSFPRLPTRFVLPAVPFWLMIAGPILRNPPRLRIFAAGTAIAVLTYNLSCSAFVGARLLEDPRMQAQLWVQQNVPSGSLFEYSAYSPVWNRLPGVNVTKRKMPFVSGRSRLFEEILDEDLWVMKSLEDTEKSGEKPLEWYTKDQLAARNPDYIAVDSRYYLRFMANPYYPSMDQFFMELLDEKYGYEIVFAKGTNEVPGWIYPRDIDFLENQITILRRKPTAPPG